MHMREFCLFCTLPRASNTLTYSQLATDRNQLPRGTYQSIERDAAFLANSGIASDMGSPD